MLLLCALTVLAACSSREFFYNRLPFLLPWYLERYVDLDREQSDAFDMQVARLLDWHRREELPRYAALLARLQERLDAPVDAAVVAEVTREMEDAWYRLRDRALDELLQLGATLDVGQIEEFLASLDERQEKYERKYLDRSEAEYRDDAVDNLDDLLKDYLGRLDASQRAILSDAAAQLQRSDSVWLAERRRWTEMLRRELRREPGWEQRIRAQVENWERRIDADTRQLYDHNTGVVQQAIAAVLDSRSPRQNKRLRRELAELLQDIEELAAG